MLVYASLDPFPAPKGAATHIAAFAATLGRAYGPLTLVTVAPGGDLAERASDPLLGEDVTHVTLDAPGRTFIDVSAMTRAPAAELATSSCAPGR